MARVTEKELAAAAVAPRVTTGAIEKNIKSEHYFTAADGIRLHQTPRGPLDLLTFCVLELQNGYTVHGVSACASPENYNEEIGKRIARENAVQQIWPLMGYELRSKLHIASQMGGSDGLGEALTRMAAYRLGNKESFRIQDAEVILAHFEGTDQEEEGGETYASVPLSDEELAKIVHRVLAQIAVLEGRPYADWDGLTQGFREEIVNRINEVRNDPEAKPVSDTLQEKVVIALIKAADSSE